MAMRASENVATKMKDPLSLSLFIPGFSLSLLVYPGILALSFGLSRDYCFWFIPAAGFSLSLGCIPGFLLSLGFIPGYSLSLSRSLFRSIPPSLTAAFGDCVSAEEQRTPERTVDPFPVYLPESTPSHLSLSLSC